MKFKNLLALYMASPQWERLKPKSKQIYMSAMEHLAEFMSREVNSIKRPDVIDFRDKTYHTRGVCRMAITVLRTVLGFGYDRGLVEYNHAARLTGMPKKVPWKRWTLDEVDHVMKEAPAHLQHVIVLALYTGQRRSDIARMRWDQYDGKYIHIIQQKTGKRLSIPVHPELKKWLALMKDYNPDITKRNRKVPCPYILHNTYNEPWSLPHMTAAISRLMNSLGYKERKLHGLRKTTASKLAEIGCSVHEITAITGQSLSEVMLYTREAEQKRLAENAMKRWEEDGAINSRDIYDRKHHSNVGYDAVAEGSSAP